MPPNSFYLLSCKCRVIFLALSVLSVCVSADDSALQFSAFGTLGVVHSDDDSAYYRANLRQPTGADKSWSADVDSKVGGQADLAINDSWWATIQVVSEYGASGNYSPEIDWAYLTFVATDNLKVRVGRLRVPTFLASDYLNVGHAFLPVRLPIDIYGQLSLYHFDGADLIYELAVSDSYLLIQPIVGYSEFDLYAGAIGGKYQGKAENILGLRVSMERKGVTYNFGYFQTDLTTTSTALTDFYDSLTTASAGFPPAGSLLVDLETSGRKTKWLTLGLRYEGQQLLIMCEYGRRDAESDLTGSNESSYILGGYRMGRWTPYLLYSELNKTSDSSDSRLPAVGPLAPLAAVTNALLQGNLENSYTTGVGVRYDIASNWSIKAQYQQISGGGHFFESKQATAKPQRTGVLSAAINFVY